MDMFIVKDTGMRAKITAEERYEILEAILQLTRQCKDAEELGREVADLILERKLMTQEHHSKFERSGD